jgi:hypothetical protein
MRGRAIAVSVSRRAAHGDVDQTIVVVVVIGAHGAVQRPRRPIEIGAHLVTDASHAAAARPTDDADARPEIFGECRGLERRVTRLDLDAETQLAVLQRRRREPAAAA